MALLDIIRKKKKTVVPIKELDDAPRAKKNVPDESEREKPARTLHARGGSLGVLRAHRVTEKSARLGEASTYVFIVNNDATKPAIRRSVEGRYGVTVRSVRTITTHGKERRRGNQVGWKPGIKKAMVTLKEGEKIEIQ